MELPSNDDGGAPPLYVGTGLKQAIEEYKQLIYNVPKEIQRLITMADRIRSVLKDAEEKQISSHEVRHLLMKGKEALLDAEDLLDELNTDAAAQQMMGGHGGKKARTELGHHRTNNAPTMTPAVMHQIREINGTLDDLAPQVTMLGLHIPSGEDSRLNLWKRRQTSSLLPDETSVIGRDREKEEIISKLLLPSTEVAESSRGNGGFSVLPIVGMGGVGKTTLAQLVFNDLDVRKHFELMMWVCVSNDFETERLTREIIEAALNQPYQINNWDTMQQKLLQEVEGKTFLLVLDDVWEAKPSEWERLCKPLHFGKKGSKVLVTTRSGAAVDKIQGRMDPVLLGGLSEDDMWSLLRRYAFRGVSAEHRHLEPIGRSIVRKLKGSPLAARTVGSLLNTELDVRHWQTVLESRLWMSKQHDILPALELSYQYLPGDNLKQCFAYCSLFPKDYEFDMEQVVQLWEALCFVRLDDYRRARMEAAGNEYFNELLHRSFFQHAPNSWRGKNMYVMHDLMHDLAESVSRDDCFRLEDQKPVKNPDTVRHISVCVTGFDQANMNYLLCRHVKLRSLMFLGTSGVDGLNRFTLDELFSQLKLLRALGLHHCGIREMPSSIGDLKHLRYLDLSWNGGLNNLPGSLANLYNLQVLNLEGCYSVRALPARMSELINLRQLRAPAVKLVSGIDGLGKMTALQELTVTERKVRELGGMSMLRRLTIRELQEVGTKEEAIQARLHNMECLQVLQLQWYRGNNTEADEEVLQALRPSCGIERLHIEGYSGVRTPDWLEAPMSTSFSSLRHLELERCPKWQVLPSSLSGLHRLEFLKISGMGQWEEWSTGPLRHGDRHHPDSSQQNPSSSASMLFFPCLRELELHHCPKLDLPPLLPPTLRRLFLHGVGISCLVGLWGCNCCGGGAETASSSHLPSVPTALSTLHIHKCCNLTSISGLLQHDLPSLEEIDIENCEELVNLLPERGLGHLVALKKLRIESCPRLTSAPVMREEEEEDNPSRSQRLPCSLEQLHIKGCGDAMGGWWWWDRLQCLSSLAKLSLHGCPSPTTAESLFVSLERHHGHPHSPVTSLRELVIRGFRCDNQQESTTPTTSSRLPPPPPPLTRTSNPPLVEETSAGVFRVLTSPTDLTMNETPNVVQKWGGGGLPSSLEGLDISGNVRSSLNLSRLSSLVSLNIYHCPSIQSLSVMPSFLEDLTLDNCPSIQSLPAMPSSLQKLTLHNCPSIQSLPAMPSSLQKLTLHYCPSIQSLPEMPPSLRSLNIDSFPSIQSLPAMPSSLEKLTLYNLGDLCSLPNSLSRLSSLGSLTIGNFHSIQSLPAMPPSLSELSLFDLENLVSLPDMSSCLSSLQCLHISQLSIQSLPAAGLPPSLRTLGIYDCPSLTERYIFGTKSMWPEVSHIPLVTIDEEELE